MANLKQLLKEKLTPSELLQLRRSLDIVVSIAVVEIPRELVKKQKIIAAAVLKNQKNVKTVLKKTGKRTSVCRVPRLVHLLGEKTTVTTAMENGVRLKVDLAKAYFSPRLATERKRIYQQVRKGEKVLVMFSGVGPYTLSIAKNTDAAAVVGVEKNPAAHRFAEENRQLNKAANVANYCGDVRKIVPLLGTFDRIVMPLPKGAEPFLNTALQAAKKHATIHYYDFLHEKDIPAAAVEKIKKHCKAAKRKCTVLRTIRCGQLAPRQYRVCIDFEATLSEMLRVTKNDGYIVLTTPIEPIRGITALASARNISQAREAHVWNFLDPNLLAEMFGYCFLTVNPPEIYFRFSPLPVWMIRQRRLAIFDDTYWKDPPSGGVKPELLFPHTIGPVSRYGYL